MVIEQSNRRPELLHNRNHCPDNNLREKALGVIERRPRVQFPALILILRGGLVSLHNEENQFGYATSYQWAGGIEFTI